MNLAVEALMAGAASGDQEKKPKQQTPDFMSIMSGQQNPLGGPAWQPPTMSLDPKKNQSFDLTQLLSLMR